MVTDTDQVLGVDLPPTLCGRGTVSGIVFFVHRERDIPLAVFSEVCHSAQSLKEKAPYPEPIRFKQIKAFSTDGVHLPLTDGMKRYSNS
jgi:hypothetical protein